MRTRNDPANHTNSKYKQSGQKSDISFKHGIGVEEGSRVPYSGPIAEAEAECTESTVSLALENCFLLCRYY
jgi:hypothetical protein